MGRYSLGLDYTGQPAYEYAAIRTVTCPATRPAVSGRLAV